MVFKILVPLFLQVLAKEIILAQCIPACNGRTPSLIPLSPFASPLAGVSPSADISPIAMAEAMGFPKGYTPSFRSGFPIQSASPVLSSGLSIRSDNGFEGPLSVAGRLPFLSAVAVEGTVPSVGAGGVLYGCAAKEFGIAREEIGPIAAGNLARPELYPGRLIL